MMPDTSYARWMQRDLLKYLQVMPERAEELKSRVACMPAAIDGRRFTIDNLFILLPSGAFDCLMGMFQRNGNNPVLAAIDYLKTGDELEAEDVIKH